ncbi:MAG TPA: DUF3054 domain-containing protein [Ilumatobacteraceae bacterium]|nr:DUF3054 domain-containing protein [Ilumatobacteraceae bacterium]
MSRTASTAAKAAAADVLAIVFFVVAGRRSHDESESITEILKVLAPFAIALAVAWVAARAWQRPLDAWSTGIALWLGTAGGGLLLRRFVFQRSTAFGFVIVGSVFLLAALVGWRLVAEWWRGRRSS